MFDDAQKMLQKVLESKSLQAVGQVGFYPCNSVGDDMYIYEDDNERKGEPRSKLYGLRQQVSKVRRLTKICFNHNNNSSN